jgi:aryl-alcohol dehydrogenase-like predicted oxidoreductase
VAAENDKTVAQLAVAWVLAHSAVSSALCGARRPEQIVETIGGANWPLSDELLQRIDRILVTTNP